VKVRYFLPPINALDLSNTDWDKSDIYGRHKVIIKMHKGILKPMFDWMNEQDMPQSCKPTFDYNADIMLCEIKSCVTFDLPNEHAMMFVMKFGKGYDYRT
jgi:hypothetical protein